jgi:hypothetical protein
MPMHPVNSLSGNAPYFIILLGMSRLIGTADKSADIWRFQNNR